MRCFLFIFFLPLTFSSFLIRLMIQSRLIPFAFFKGPFFRKFYKVSDWINIFCIPFSVHALIFSFMFFYYITTVFRFYSIVFFLTFVFPHYFSSLSRTYHVVRLCGALVLLMPIGVLLGSLSYSAVLPFNPIQSHPMESNKHRRNGTHNENKMTEQYILFIAVGSHHRKDFSADG